MHWCHQETFMLMMGVYALANLPIIGLIMCLFKRDKHCHHECDHASEHE